MRLVIAAFAFALSSAAARAEDSRLEIGIGAGAAIPYGNIAGGTYGIADLISAGAAIEADVGYRFLHAVYRGVYGGYSYLFTTNCHATDCSAHMFRVGGQVQFHPAEGSIDPWFGIGFGYEWFDASAVGNGSNEKLEMRGPEFTAQTGVDFAVSPRLEVGPFVSASIAAYSGATATGSIPSGNAGPLEQTVHGWFLFGLRARL